MKTWTKILPFWFISWYARRNCEVFWVSGQDYVSPYAGVLIRKDIPTISGDAADSMSELK